MVDKNIFYSTVIWNRILITADDINKSLDDTIHNILVENNEGKCVREGFIKEDSIKLLKRSVPYVYGNQMNGKLYVDVLYETEICCPMRGNIIECNIEKLNKLGILASSGPLSIIIARDFHKNKDLFKGLKENTSITIEIIDKKFNINEKKISVIAKIHDKNNKQDIEEDEVNLEDTVGPNNNSDVGDTNNGNDEDEGGDEVDASSDDYNEDEDEYDVSDTESEEED
jgi:DNA-directed RNA polymerase subunit E'/Rpb7